MTFSARLTAVILFVLSFFGMSWIVFVISGQYIGTDWHWAYYPAAHALMGGHTPYFGRLFNPPWVLLPILPIALLPGGWGAAVMFVANIFSFVVVLLRLRTHSLFIAPLIIFSGILFNSTNGNIDGLCALGFIMPAPVGLFFVLAKPQLGIGVAAYWAWCAWRDGGWRRLVATFSPILIAYSLSFIMFGNWMNTNGLVWAASTIHVFPYSIPIGVLFIVTACRRRSMGLAIASGVLFSPYVNLFTWSFLWIGLAIEASRFALSYRRHPAPQTAHP